MDLSTKIHGLDERNRYFIALVPVHTSQNILEKILLHIKWIGFNIFDLRGSKFYSVAKERGIRDAFNIGDDKKIFLTSTQKDEQLERFYEGSNGIAVFKSDVVDFDVDMAMGPDWYVYCDQPPDERRKHLKKALDLNEKCVELENVAPNVHGTNFREMTEFIELFKAQGKSIFVIPGREYLINLDDRKKSQREFSSLTSTIAREERIKIIITGCSSPKLQENLPDVSGFAGLGWLIQARCRRLVFGKTYRSLFDPAFSCNDPNCCGSFDRYELARPERDATRAIHNLRKIQSQLVERPKFSQSCLVGS